MKVEGDDDHREAVPSDRRRRSRRDQNTSESHAILGGERWGEMCSGSEKNVISDGTY